VLWRWSRPAKPPRDIACLGAIGQQHREVGPCEGAGAGRPGVPILNSQVALGLPPASRVNVTSVAVNAAPVQ